jgi:hypothetical protein
LTPEEKRFHAACAAMYGFLANTDNSFVHVSDVAKEAVICADALLKRLAETAPKETVCVENYAIDKKCEHRRVKICTGAEGNKFGLCRDCAAVVTI